MSQEKRANKITLEDLVSMVAHGFERVDARFEAVDARFEVVDARFKALEAHVNERFDDIENKIDQINDRFVPWHAFDRLTARVDKLEGN